jgi:hypothetical protein
VTAGLMVANWRCNQRIGLTDSVETAFGDDKTLSLVFVCLPQHWVSNVTKS